MIDYNFSICLRAEISAFIELHHYSHNINGVMSQFCFKIENKAGNLVGAMIFGKVGMANAWKKYADSESEIMELRRLVCIDNTPRNTESWFIGRALKWLEKNTTLRLIVSYADKTYGHAGTIYRAANFQYMGETAKGKMIQFGDRLYHDKTIRTKYKGALKPFAVKIKNALADGTASYVQTMGKHIFLYKLNAKERRGIK